MRVLPLVVVLIGGLSLACAAAPCGEGTVEKDGECVAVDPDGVGETDDTGTGGDSDPVIVDVRDNGDSRTVTWTVEVDGAASEATIWLIETGASDYDDGGDCGADAIGSGGLVCNVWAERHTAFEVSDGGATLTLTLEVAERFDEQQGNVSTLFASEYLELVAFLVEIDGGVDCVAGGHDPRNFADDCPNEL